MIVLLTIIIFVIIHLSVLNYNICIPYGLISLIIGYIWGHLLKICDYLQDFDFTNKVSDVSILSLYFPVLIFRIAFCSDVHSFLRTLPQILIVSLPICILTACATGIILQITIDYGGEFWYGLIFGIMCAPIYTYYIKIFLERYQRTRIISVFLEGESLVSMIVIFFINSVLEGYGAGVTIRWYQFTMVFLRVTLFGLLCGYVAGLLGRYLLRSTGTNPALSILMGVCFLTFTSTKIFFGGSGSLAVTVFGVMMAIERSSMREYSSRMLAYIWRGISTFIDVMISIKVSSDMVVNVDVSNKTTDYILVFVTYMVYYLMRFCFFLLFTPILNKLGSHWNVRTMIICVWCGIKSPCGLFLLVLNREGLTIPKDIVATFYLHIVGLHFLSLLINGGLTPVLMYVCGMSDVSLGRVINMNNCIKSVNTMKRRTIGVLKKDKFMAGVDWSLVGKLTKMRHPYEAEMEVTSKDYDWYLGLEKTFCPECSAEIFEEPTAKELSDMMSEAKEKVLRAKKISYSRQYENGMMSQETIHFLIELVEVALDSKEGVIALDKFCENFNKECCWHRFLSHCVKYLAPSSRIVIIPPRKHCRRICYNFVTKRYFELFIYGTVVLNVALIIVNMTENSVRVANGFISFFLTMTVVFFIVYFLEFLMKILAYSHRGIWKEGFFIYLKCTWNIIDFVILYGVAINVFLTFFYGSEDNQGLNFAIDSLRLTIVAKLLRLFGELHPLISHYLANSIDCRSALNYEIGRCYMTGENEILQLLPYIVDNKKVRAEVKAKLEADRLRIIKLMNLVQKEKPLVAITIKSMQALRTVLHSMRDSVEELKTLGWIDDFEYVRLNGSTLELDKKVRMINSIKPSAPRILFREVSWMKKKIVDFLFDNVTIKRYKPGDVVVQEGTVCEGIYIVIVGFLKIIYEPTREVFINLHKYGRLPIVDYITCTQFEEPIIDYIVAGNCVGELGTLTERAYNCKIVTNSETQVYILSKELIKKAMHEMDPDPIYGLESRIWKVVGIRKILPILLSLPMYQFSPQQIKYDLEKAFVPNLSRYKYFIVNSDIQHIFLVEGVVSDEKSKQVFVAPCVIPRSARSLILGKHKRAPVNVETKMLIVPDVDASRCDIITYNKDTCTTSFVIAEKKCLRHALQEKRKISKDNNNEQKTSEVKPKSSKEDDVLSEFLKESKK